MTEPEILRAERDWARSERDHLLRVLVGIHALLPPEPVKVGEATMVFHDPNANDTLRELKRRIAAIEDECRAALAQKSGTVNNPA